MLWHASTLSMNMSVLTEPLAGRRKHVSWHQSALVHSVWMVGGGWRRAIQGGWMHA
jgi:ribosome modulation factor